MPGFDSSANLTEPSAETIEQTPADSAQKPQFRVSLDVFDGPFDLLLNLIGKHELDITEVALGQVTDEFISYVSQLQESDAAGLNRASEFLVVAATLLDLKIASLLPQGQAVESEDIALLEARDLLFARLLQYRAFKQAAEWFAAQFAQETQRIARRVPLEEKYRGQRQQMRWTVTAADLAALAAAAFAPKELPQLGLDHLHAPTVSIREQAAYVVVQLRQRGQLSFRDLVSGAPSKGVIVARFLAILELYRRDAVSFEQAVPLGDLIVRWVAPEWDSAQLNTLGEQYDN